MLEAMLLGMLQGLTEFLPISSSGHLGLAELLFDVEGAGLALNVMLHAGTLVSIVIVLRNRLFGPLVEGVRGIAAPRRFTETPGGRDALFVVVATLPTAVIGLVLRDWVERATHSPVFVGLGFAVTGAVLVSTRWVKPGSLTVPGVRGALLIGLCQGIAVLPGISRSGATIAAALWTGVRADRAFELSMLMSVPAVLGAVILELPRVDASTGGFGMAGLGAGISCLVGIAALWLLSRLVRANRLHWFAVYVFPLAVATLAMAWVWP
ncbi:MAG TPA: undecaprenyl-diphosphate phosphatase [Polyangiaceae bacterium]|jgi:undecaprenyl-diphosphatase